MLQSSAEYAVFDVLSERWAWRTVTALAFTAGGVDTVGLSALGRFVSHMSGTTSTLAGALTSRAEGLAFLCTAVLCAFTSGAIVTGFVIASGRLHDARRVASFLLIFETGLLLAAAGALCGPAAGPEDFPRIATAAGLLAGAMGCQNRTGVFVAGGKARTTHVTGTLTDLGYHLGRLIQRGPLARSTREEDAAAAHRLLALFAGFLAGGLTGRAIFLVLGGASSLVFAAVPATLCALALAKRT